MLAFAEDKPGLQPKVPGTGPAGGLLTDLQPKTPYRQCPLCLLSSSLHSGASGHAKRSWPCRVTGRTQPSLLPQELPQSLCLSQPAHQNQLVAGHPSASAVSCVNAHPPPQRTAHRGRGDIGRFKSQPWKQYVKVREGPPSHFCLTSFHHPGDHIRHWLSPSHPGP